MTSFIISIAFSVFTHAIEVEGLASIYHQAFHLSTVSFRYRVPSGHHCVVLHGDVLTALELMKAISSELGCQRSYTI